MDSFLSRYLGGPSFKTGYHDMLLGTPENYAIL